MLRYFFKSYVQEEVNIKPTRRAVRGKKAERCKGDVQGSRAGMEGLCERYKLRCEKLLPRLPMPLSNEGVGPNKVYTAAADEC